MGLQGDTRMPLCRIANVPIPAIKTMEIQVGEVGTIDTHKINLYRTQFRGTQTIQNTHSRDKSRFN